MNGDQDFMENYFSIGKLVATFGVGGELVLRHSLGKKTALKGVETLFIEEKNNCFIPYFIEKTKIKNEREVYVKLEGIEKKETAQLLLQKEIYFNETDFHQYAAPNSYLSLLGYMVQEASHGMLGCIEEIIEMPLQMLAKLHYRSKELLIPLNEQTLVRIDKKGKRVFVDLPKGLLEVYLGQ